MLRAAWLIFQNEYRLLVRDRAALFMLLLAPIVISAVAGFSLGNIYGTQPGSEPYKVVILNFDRGWLASAVIEALGRDRSLKVIETDDMSKAKTIVSNRSRTPVAIEIPANTTRDFEAGRNPKLGIYIDPVKRLEATSIEQAIDAILREITVAANHRVRIAIEQQSSDLKARLGRAAAEIAQAKAQLELSQAKLERALKTSQSDLDAQIRETRRRTLDALDRSIEGLRTTIAHDTAARQAALAAVRAYLSNLESSRSEFENWISQLKTLAGSRADRIPPPPKWPTPPTPEQLAVLSQPFAVPEISASRIVQPDAALHLPSVPKQAIPAQLPIPDLSNLAVNQPARVPGVVGWTEQALGSESPRVNTFDQYVPGFGVTFLLVDMLWGVAVGLIDERDWGTLSRLRASGLSTSGLLIGKLMARVLIGLVQLIILFAVAWAMFSLSLGRTSWALLMPAAAISFAAAAFSLLIACVADSRDAVLPIGAMAALAMSAIGGCWWPLDFEPQWMRTIALAMPTTWTMRAFNDLLIRGFEPAAVVRSSAITAGLGLLFLAAGVAGSSRIYRQR